MGRRARKTREEPEVPVSSFSDIAFLLIIFFILATTLTQLAGIRTEIPSGAKSDAPPEQSTIVNLHDGAISLNDEQMTIEVLREKLAGMDLHNKSGDDKVVLLESSGNIPYQLYYNVLTAITHAGGAIAIVEEEGE